MATQTTERRCLRSGGSAVGEQAQALRTWADLVQRGSTSINYRLEEVLQITIIILGFWTISGQTWPRDPSKRVGLDKLCRTHPKLPPENKF